MEEAKRWGSWGQRKGQWWAGLGVPTPRGGDQGGTAGLNVFLLVAEQPGGNWGCRGSQLGALQPQGPDTWREACLSVPWVSVSPSGEHLALG